MSSDHTTEVQSGDRFRFGENWQRFLAAMRPERIEAAQRSLETLFGSGYLRDRTFLDIGSGSGLFSLAARKLGSNVTSFDFDPQSVACTAELKRRFFPEDPLWSIASGSILDAGLVEGLGRFDIVYSWGVLHHTGRMWEAIENATKLVRPGGRLCIAIYNDQGRASRYWLAVKRAYCKSPKPVRALILAAALARLWGPTTVRDLLAGRPGATWKSYGSSERGMSPWRDVVDWVGGYPFEVAKPEGIFEFCAERGFKLLRLRTCAGGHGCNEYVFGS
jgi:2-polyprenyl-6-hydroxyphenyl methylase/3-demethylubiquinone-9 3-methyltransferase